jgi:glycosyltransferase involved in cell wall biosynthesis
MKILLDPQIFNQQKHGGVSRYYTEIFSILSKKKDVNIVVPINNSTNVYFNRSSLVTIQQRAYYFYCKVLIKLRVNNKLKLETIKNKYVSKILSKQSYDIFIPTYYDDYFVELIGSKPFVLTVYDMIYELFPEYFIHDKMVVANKKLLMEKAARIIAVSENTKKDIIKLYPHIDSTKIDIVYHGCSIKINNKSIVSLPENYILFVGTRAIYKNFIFFVNSIVVILKSDPNLFLICAGGGDFNVSENQFINELGLTSQIIQKHFDEEKLDAFYRNAKCFVFPSLYEGFGLPVLESMACGCPVVLGNHSSFPEVAGSAGLYFELNNPDDLKNKINSLIQDETLRDEFSMKGLEQVKKFSWEKAALECLNVYRKAGMT